MTKTCTNPLLTGDKVTDKELDRIEKLVKAATPGPFHWVSIGRGTCDSLYILMDGREATRNDQYLFAHAQADMAALVAEVRRLRLQMEHDHHIIDRLQRGCDTS